MIANSEEMTLTEGLHEVESFYLDTDELTAPPDAPFSELLPERFVLLPRDENPLV